MTKKQKPVVKVRYSSCELFATWPMVCPLCGVAVPANTPHKCQKESK